MESTSWLLEGGVGEEGTENPQDEGGQPWILQAGGEGTLEQT